MRTHVFDLIRAFGQTGSMHKWVFSSPKRLFFLHACVTCSELPFNKSSKGDASLGEKKCGEKRRKKNWRKEEDILYI